MVGFGFSTTSAMIIAAASLLPGFQAGAQAVYLQHLRKLDTDEYTSLGCFKDSGNDRVLGNKMDDGVMTTKMCLDYCHEMDAPLMATQYGAECWCSTEIEVDYERHGEGAECDHPCAGNENEMCGGYNAFSLYLIESNDVTSSHDDFPAPTPSSGGLDGALSPDIVKIINVVGDDPGGLGWADSYSVGDKCYMHSTFDHDIGGYTVDTPQGTMTILDLYNKLKEGPGYGGHPLYNDIQCGNGPANSAPDEERCPGLVEFGPEGCGQIGPLWDLTELE